ncbi:MAG: patatin-like phospholipase family protein, partial [Planctomycetota bacterium]
KQIFTPREPHQPRGWIRSFYPTIKWVLKQRTGQDFDDFFRAKYCPIALEDAFDHGFGDATLRDVVETRLIVPTVNLSLGQSQLYRSAHLPGLEADSDARLVDVLLAATAAPTYFPHKSMPNGQAYCDGGLWANSPTILAIAEAMKIKQQCSRESCDPDYDTSSIRVLSIGAGTARFSLSPPGNDAGIIYWAQHVANVMINLQVEGVQSPLEFFLGDRYQCINFDLPDKTWTLDNTDNIEELISIGRSSADQHYEQLESSFFKRSSPAFVPF